MAGILTQEAKQPAVTTLPDRVWDIVIVGAGPAGSVAGFFLAGDGHDVLLIDKKRFPREKVCGDFLFTDVIKFLRKVGLLDAVRKVAYEVKSIVAHSPSGVPVNVPGECLTLRRAVFDQLLVNNAVEAGAVFAFGKVEDIQADDSVSKVTVSVAESTTVIRARVCVLATGADVALADRIGFIRRKEPSSVAVRCYVRSQLDLPQVIISYDRSLIPGYSWIVPLGHNEFNIGCGTSYRRLTKRRYKLKKAFVRFLTDFPPARQLMEQGEIITRLRGAALRCNLTKAGLVTKGNIVVTGETIGTTLPFTCEGVGTALVTGEMAAEAISEALRSQDLKLLQNYPQRLAKEMNPKHEGYALAEKWMSYRWLSDFMAWRFNKSTFLRGQLQDFLAGNGQARAVYAPLKILQSFWK